MLIHREISKDNGLGYGCANAIPVAEWDGYDRIVGKYLIKDVFYWYGVEHRAPPMRGLKRVRIQCLRPASHNAKSNTEPRR